MVAIETQSRQAEAFWSPRQRKRPYTASREVAEEVEKKREGLGAVALEERDWRTVLRLVSYWLLGVNLVELSQTLRTKVGSDFAVGVRERRERESERKRAVFAAASMIELSE